MNVTQVKHNEEGGYSAVIAGQNLSVPDDLRNRHRREIQEWMDAGNIPEAAPTPKPAPTISEEIASRRTGDRVLDEMFKRIEILEGR